ncbi:hypothetical protein [Vibrio sp. K4]|uniref:hypothetical protein n=1 Tax=Vibrio sp. K4 TaxID=3391579 RepID=UPI003DA72BDC
MAIRKITGFHTCAHGKYEEVTPNIPFRSTDNDEEQWLSPGYYLWTDSPYYAERWKPREYRAGGAKIGHAPTRKVIGKFDIQLDDDTTAREFLDLVGNTKDQEKFVAYKKKVLGLLRKSDKDTIYVSQIISFLRNAVKRTENRDIFPYLAIKAMDGRFEERIRFVDEKYDKHNRMLSLITPQQICVFDEGKDRIKHTGYHSPHDFKMKFISNTK